MVGKTENILKPFLKEKLPEIRPGDLVRVRQIIKEDDKQRRQDFEGIVIAVKHGKGISGTITVRKDVKGIGVERVFPIHSPAVEKIEVLKRHKTRRSKLYYLRSARGRKAKLKPKE